MEPTEVFICIPCPLGKSVILTIAHVCLLLGMWIGPFHSAQAPGTCVDLCLEPGLLVLMPGVQGIPSIPRPSSKGQRIGAGEDS